MAEAIEDSLTLMRDDDLAAIAVYLKNAPASANGPAALLAANDPRMQNGKALYRDNCEACHNADGSGQSVIFPPLAGNPIVRQSSAQTLAHVVLAGTQAAQTRQAPTAPAMPYFAWRLSDAQIADLLTYVRGSWGNRAAPVSSGVVASVRQGLHP
jgi:mono/diheme cytochrome c family protein